jgi:flagellar motor switch protein FliM
MAAEVEPQEVQAILEALGKPGAAPRARSREVAVRDFTRPLRLSPADLEHWRQAVEAALPEAGRELARVLRRDVRLELAGILEVSARDVIASLRPPLAAGRFDVRGQPGWLVWRPADAACAVELALGAPDPPARVERALTSVERQMLAELLTPLARRVAAGIGCEAAELRVVQDIAQLGAPHDAGAGDDPQRLHVSLAVEGLGETSTLDLYLPGLAPIACDPGRAGASPLPVHLRAVDAELSARLGAAEIPLDALLALEVGDVIALCTPREGLLRVLVEGVECAAARLGVHEGRLAIQIERAGPAPRTP